MKFYINNKITYYFQNSESQKYNNIRVASISVIKIILCLINLQIKKQSSRTKYIFENFSLVKFTSWLAVLLSTKN